MTICHFIIKPLYKQKLSLYNKNVSKITISLMKRVFMKISKWSVRITPFIIPPFFF